MKDLIKKIIVEGWELKLKYIPRGLVPPELARARTSLVIIGPRRAGKSYTMYEMIEKLGKGFIYINFEDERLSGFKANHFDLILEAYYSLREEKPVMFFDEIQNVEGWERFVRRVADRGYKIVVTGSNSRMLSREIGEKLGGRFVEIDVYPLTFREFLKFKGLNLNKEDFYSRRRFRIKRYFDEYLEFGGFPEVSLFSEKESKEKVLRTYFDLVFYKDIVSREKVENEEALKFIIMKLRENIGKIITPRRIYSLLKNAGISVGPNTVERYLSYLEGAFLVIPSFAFSKSPSKQIRKKRYFVDNGYVKLFEINKDRGIMLENMVFMELIKTGSKVSYHLGKRECDFIRDSKEAIQVTYELNDENRKREIEGLLEAMEAYNLKKGYIITYDQEEEIKVDRKKIRVIPAWKWALKLG